MHHTSARRVISWLLEGSSFGRRGLALTAASELGDASQEAVRLRDRSLQMSSALPIEKIESSSSTAAHAELPANESQLCQQMCVEIIANPAEIALKLANLGAVVRLWPHVGADERARLRNMLLQSFAAQKSPSESILKPETLRAWQSRLPTYHGVIEKLQTSALRELLNNPDPAAVYVGIVNHLHPGCNLNVLFRVVGSLAIRMRLSHRDRDCRLHHMVLGAIAAEELVRYASPGQMATILTQLVHQMWWALHHAGLEVRPSSNVEVGVGFIAGVASGDPVRARREARAASQNPENFWNDAWIILEGLLQDQAPGWPEALTTIVAIAWRTGPNVISPDDAALIGLVFADPVCTGQRMVSV